MSSKLFLATLLTVMLAFVATPAKAVFIPNNALYINKNSTVAKIASQSETNGTLGDCICFDFKCSCCSHFKIREINLDDTVCLNITYLKEDIGIEVTINIDSYVLYENVVSVRNPPEVCADIPYLKKAANICFRFYDMVYHLDEFSGCLELIARLAAVKVSSYKVGCFHLGNHQASYDIFHQIYQMFFGI